MGLKFRNSRDIGKLRSYIYSNWSHRVTGPFSIYGSALGLSKQSERGGSCEQEIWRQPSESDMPCPVQPVSQSRACGPAGNTHSFEGAPGCERFPPFLCSRV